MTNLLKIFNQTMVSTKGKELLLYHDFPIRRLYYYVPPCAVIVPPHVVNKLCHITVQERGNANQLPSIDPLLNMGMMFGRPILIPFTLEGYSVKVDRYIHDKWNRLLHPKLMEYSLRMMPLHYPKVDQRHLSLLDMLPTVQYTGREPSTCVYSSHTICISGLLV